MYCFNFFLSSVSILLLSLSLMYLSPEKYCFHCVVVIIIDVSFTREVLFPLCCCHYHWCIFHQRSIVSIVLLSLSLMYLSPEKYCFHCVVVIIIDVSFTREVLFPLCCCHYHWCIFHQRSIVSIVLLSLSLMYLSPEKYCFHCVVVIIIDVSFTREVLFPLCCCHYYHWFIFRYRGILMHFFFILL